MKIHQNKNSYLVIVFILSIVIPIGFLKHSQRKIQEIYDAGIFASSGINNVKTQVIHLSRMHAAVI